MNKKEKPMCVMKAPPPKEIESELPLLNRDSILNSEDKVTYELEVPEWGGVLFIRVISGGERSTLEKLMQDYAKSNGSNLDYRATFAAMVVSDSDGNKLFSKTDIDELSKKSGIALDRVFDYGMKVNFINEEEIQEEVKNSESVRSKSSGSD